MTEKPAAASHPTPQSTAAQPATGAHPSRDNPENTPSKKRKKHRKRAIIAGSLTLSLLLGGTAAWAANRYLIEHVEISDATAYEAAHSSTQTATSTQKSSDYKITADTYTSANTKITISKQESGSGQNKITYYVADVTLKDAATLRSAFADNSFGQNIVEKVSTIAAQNNAVFAINGDYYGFRDSGILIRNGVIYRDTPARTGLAIYKDGTMRVYDETSTSAKELLAAGVINTLSFGPAILENGEMPSNINSIEVDTNFGNHSIQGTQPRTAIGIIDTNHFVFVVVDGRSPGYSRGATLTELANILQKLGASTAYNLDGGGSSEMWFNGTVVNQPANGGERATSDILYIGEGA